MEPWEACAREEIRELVASYTHLGDGGRIPEMALLFEPTAVLKVEGRGEFTGHDEIAGFFGGLADDTVADHTVSYIRHHVSNLTITVTSPAEAHGAAYWTVVNDHGLARWGRYRDTYHRAGEGPWRFATRYIRHDRAAGTPEP